MDYPFAGSRMMQGLLKQDGFEIGRKHTARLMKKMGIEALYRRPRTSKPGPGHKIYPYLLRQMKVTQANQVWAMDISYITMAKGFVYLAAVIDWFTRRVLAWRVSITMETAFCVEALEEALEKYQTPDIFNTGQGSQFTPDAFTGVLLKRGISIAMDGKGAQAATMSLPRGCGDRSNTRRSISGPTPRWPKPGTAWAVTSPSTTPRDRIRHLTAEPPIKPTSARSSSRLPLNQTQGLHSRNRENCSDEWGHFTFLQRCPCQKQPCTKMIFRRDRNARSGFPGSSAECRA